MLKISYLLTSVLSFLLGIQACLATIQTMNYEVSSQAGRSPSGESTISPFNQTIYRVGHEVDELYHFVTVAFNLSYTSTSQTELNSGESRNTFFAGDILGKISSNRHSFMAKVARSFESKEVSTSDLQTRYELSLLNKATILGLTFDHRIQDRAPSSYYNYDERGRIYYTSRATRNKVDQFSLDLYQVISERVNLLLSSGYTLPSSDRPKMYNLNFRSGLALNDRLFFKLGGGRKWEDKSEKLKNERGYFTELSYESELTYELVYDYLLSASYKLIVEREDDLNRRQVEKELAIDEYGLSLKFPFPRYSQVSVTLQSAFTYTNRKEHAVLYLGGFTWTI